MTTAPVRAASRPTVRRSGSGEHRDREAVGRSGRTPGQQPRGTSLSPRGCSPAPASATSPRLEVLWNDWFQILVARSGRSRKSPRAPGRGDPGRVAGRRPTPNSLAGRRTGRRLVPSRPSRPGLRSGTEDRGRHDLSRPPAVVVPDLTRLRDPHPHPRLGTGRSRQALTLQSDAHPHPHPRVTGHRDRNASSSSASGKTARPRPTVDPRPA